MFTASAAGGAGLRPDRPRRAVELAFEPVRVGGRRAGTETVVIASSSRMVPTASASRTCTVVLAMATLNVSGPSATRSSTTANAISAKRPPGSRVTVPEAGV